MNAAIMVPNDETDRADPDDDESRLIFLNYLIGNLKRCDELLVTKLRQAGHNNNRIGKDKASYQRA